MCASVKGRLPLQIEHGIQPHLVPELACQRFRYAQQPAASLVLVR